MCNCGGSQVRNPEVRPRGSRVEQRHVATPPNLRRGGGPGQPGYAWEGPQRPVNGPAEASHGHNGPTR